MEEPIVQVDEATTEAMFSSIDIIILVAILVVSYIWYSRRNGGEETKKDEKVENSFNNFSMAPVQESSSSEQGFISKMKSSGRNLIVFYGSQTGTAEEFAGRLSKEGARYRMKGLVADPEECEMEQLEHLRDIPNSLAIFCMATYGEGDPTDNAQTFYNWLKDENPDLSGIRYTVFGLGNKTYEHFNAVGILVDKRLEELGATRVYPLGTGDDDANIEDDFLTWQEQLWPTVCQLFGIESKGIDINMRQYQLTIHDDMPDTSIFKGEISRLNSYKNQRPPYDAKNPYLAAICKNAPLQKGGDRLIMHIEFDISGSKFRYETGDHVVVYPRNNLGLVEKLGKLCNTDLDTIITLTNIDADATKKTPFPCPTTYRTCLLYYVDITTLPRTHILQGLIDFTTDPKEKELLHLISSNTPEGKAKYNEWIIQSIRNIVHILEDLPSCKPPLDLICELLPRLQPRYYSISSSSKVHATTIHATCVLVDYETPTKRHNEGVATSWLKEKHPDNGASPTVPVYVRRSQFRLPPRIQAPTVMVGPGTGIAPFRGFIQERHWLKEQGKPVGDTILFFGCRKETEDYLYEQELKEFVEKGTLKLHVAFSRDQKDKVYVTHLMKQNAAEIWKAIGEQDGYFYVCGDAKNMARDVHNIIKEICIEHGKMTDSQANAYIKKMEAQRRYSADVWS